MVSAVLTLFREWTRMLFAPISRRSLSASYFKSFETLNLQNITGKMCQKIQKIIIQEYISEGRTHLLQQHQCSPEGSLPAQQVVLIDDARDGSALADARTVPDQVGCSVLVGQEGLVLLRTWYTQEESVQQT